MVNESHVIVRYGELSTKGKNRNTFVKQLKKNIQAALKGFENVQVISDYNRTRVILNGHSGQEVLDVVSKIFGIASCSIAVRCDKDLETMKEVALNIVKDNGYQTFKIDTKRRDKTFEESSDRINRALASHILHNTEAKVNVKEPQGLIRVEVEDRNDVFIMAKTVKGMGGYPVGVQGKGMLLLSGGIDSPVAAILTNKRGMYLEAVHFESMPYTSQNALNKVHDLAKLLTQYQPYIKLHQVHFTDLQLEIYDKCDQSYAITMMRRFMVRIAEKLAEKHSCDAIITGDSLGQVASQTIQSIDVINRASEKVILRPLTTLDKNEIIAHAKEFGTYETSILPFEDCCTVFTPTDPVIKPKLEKVLHYEARFDIDKWVNECVENAETLVFKAGQPEEEDLF